MSRFESHKDDLNREPALDRSSGELKVVRPFRDQRPFSFEPAGEVDGVRFINDSAAVTVEQTGASLSFVTEPVIWIVEANGRQGDLSLLKELVKTRVKAIVAVGKQAYEVHDALWDVAKFFTAAGSWDEALDLGVILGSDGDTVLFSPACRAVEPFQNHRDRGEYFNRLITIRNP